MILCHIVARASNGVIGNGNKLPWHLPEDLKFFKEKTKGKIMIMGRKTLESLPGLLPHRVHIVISRQAQPQSPFAPKENAPVHFVTSIDQAITLATQLSSQSEDEVFIVGGGEIYRQSLPFTQRIYLTQIHHSVDGDVTYPDVPTNFELKARDDREAFSFLTYEKVSGFF